MRERASNAGNDARIGAILSWSPSISWRVRPSHPIHTLIDPSIRGSTHRHTTLLLLAANKIQKIADRNDTEFGRRTRRVGPLRASQHPPVPLLIHWTQTRPPHAPSSRGCRWVRPPWFSLSQWSNCEIDDCLQPPLPRTEVRRPRFKDLKVPCRTCHKHHKR